MYSNALVSSATVGTTTILDTFSIRGSIDTEILGEGASCGLVNNEEGNEITPMIKFVVGQPSLLWALYGDWQMDVSQGQLIDFYANFTMVGENEADHTHSISNFIPDNASSMPIQLNPNGLTVISGTVDFKQTCHDTLSGVPATIEIDGTAKDVSITLDSAAINNHFSGEPVQGYVESVTYNTTNAPAQPQTSETPEAPQPQTALQNTLEDLCRRNPNIVGCPNN